MFVVFVGVLVCVINWGFGFVFGVMLVCEVVCCVVGSDYWLFVVFVYMGFLSWYGGLLGLILFVVVMKGNLMEKIIGLILVFDMIFIGYNVFVMIGLIVMLLFFV